MSRHVGTVLAVLPSSDEADALRLVNDTDYGLLALKEVSASKTVVHWHG